MDFVTLLIKQFRPKATVIIYITTYSVNR
jgi:hypothetical protein